MKPNDFPKMKFSKYLLLFVSISSLLFFGACDEVDDPLPDTLVANAGADQTVEAGQTVTLDGSASTDTDGNPITYAWAITASPAGSTASISSATSAIASFTPDVEGVYVISLTISNNDAAKVDEVTITATAPSAVTVELSGTQDSDLTLTDIFVNSSTPDYLVTSNFSMSGGKLTIEPGVVIAFQSDTRMWIEDSGVIVAKGTAGDPITFTGETESKGFWKGLVIWTNNPENELDYVEIKYGGSSDHGFGVPSIGLGIGDDGQCTVTNSTITENGGDYGMFVEASASINTFANNTLSNNDGNPLAVSLLEATKLDATSSFSVGNTDNSIEIFGQTGADLGGEVTLPSFADAVPYFVSGNLEVSEGGLVVSPGAVIEFGSNAYFWIDDNGYLIAKGSDSDPIVFTGKVKTKGYWRGLVIWTNNILNELDYTEVSYGGSDRHGFGVDEVSLALGDDGRAKVTNSNITNSNDIGFFIENTSELLEFSSNNFTDNDGVPLALNANNAGVLDNESTYSNNGDNAIEIFRSDKTINELTTWPKINDGTPYFVSGNIEVNAGGLKIEAGATLEFGSDVRFWVDDEGYLEAIGTNAEKITFTGRVQSAGYWKGLAVWTNNPLNQIDHAVFSYGGSSGHGFGIGEINLGLGDNGRLNVTNSEFSNSAGFGLFTEAGTTINADAATVNTFSNNVTDFEIN